MSNSEEQLMASLAEKFLAGTATEAEQEQLHQLYDKWKDDEEQVVSDTGHPDELRAEILQAIYHRIREKKMPAAAGKWWRYAAAASILIALLSLYLYIHPPVKNAPVAERHKDVPAGRPPVLPGKDRAILTLADGSVI